MITMVDGLSARGQAFFREKARRQQLHSADESAYSGPEDLVARLRELDRVWGGVELGHYHFGTAAAQSDEWLQQRAVDGQAVAAFGTNWSRTPIYASGRLFEREDWSRDARVRPLAESVLRFVERLALADWLASRPVAAELDRRLASPLAQALGLEPLAAASGADASVRPSPSREERSHAHHHDRGARCRCRVVGSRGRAGEPPPADRALGAAGKG